PALEDEPEGNGGEDAQRERRGGEAEVLGGPRGELPPLLPEIGPEAGRPRPALGGRGLPALGGEAERGEGVARHPPLALGAPPPPRSRAPPGGGGSGRACGPRRGRRPRAPARSPAPDGGRGSRPARAAPPGRVGRSCGRRAAPAGDRGRAARPSCRRRARRSAAARPPGTGSPAASAG